MVKPKKKLFPRNRRFVLDILSAAKQVPAFPVEREFSLAAVAEARQKQSTRISWAALFVKAWAIVSAKYPNLRQLYVQYPIRHFYVHPTTVAAVSVNRTDEDGSNFLVFLRVRNAEDKSLQEIQSEFEFARQADPRKVFKDGYDLVRWPKPIRGMIWHVLMRWWGRKKAKKLGTFSMSTLAGQGAMNRFHPLITTTSLAYGPLSDCGKSLVTLLCDHRAIDGYDAANGLAELERVLQTEILEELKESATQSATYEPRKVA